jgi:hypothetical protein
MGLRLHGVRLRRHQRDFAGRTMDVRLTPGLPGCFPGRRPLMPDVPAPTPPVPVTPTVTAPQTRQNPPKRQPVYQMGQSLTAQGPVGSEIQVSRNFDPMALQCQQECLANPAQTLSIQLSCKCPGWPAAVDAGGQPDAGPNTPQPDGVELWRLLDPDHIRSAASTTLRN